MTRVSLLACLGLVLLASTCEGQDRDLVRNAMTLATRCDQVCQRYEAVHGKVDPQSRQRFYDKCYFLRRRVASIRTLLAKLHRTHPGVQTAEHEVSRTRREWEAAAARVRQAEQVASSEWTRLQLRMVALRPRIDRHNAEPPDPKDKAACAAYNAEAAQLNGERNRMLQEAERIHTTTMREVSRLQLRASRANTLQSKAKATLAKLQRERDRIEDDVRREMETASRVMGDLSRSLAGTRGQRDSTGAYARADPFRLTLTARTLVSAKKHKLCTRFLRDYAEQVFGYTGLGFEVNANRMIERIQRGSDWKALHDVKDGSWREAAVQDGFRQAQLLANQGFLVVVGWKTGKAGEKGGHVAVVVPGKLEKGTKWKKAGLPDFAFPQIAQAGDSLFAEKKLSSGFPPGALRRGRFVIYVRKP